MAEAAANHETGFQVPSYTISYAADGTLQFDPAQGSRELAVALSLQFPLQRTLEEKMREAQLSFLRSPQRETVIATIQPKIPTTTNSIARPTQHVAQRDNSTLRLMQSPRTISQGQSLDSAIQEPTTPLQPPSQSKTKKRPRKSRAKAGTQPQGPDSANQHVWNLNSGETALKKTRRTLGLEEAVQVAANRGNVCDHHKAKRTKCDPTKCPENKLYQGNMFQSPSLNYETSCRSPSAALDPRTCYLEGCKISAGHSHLPEFDPGALRGDNEMVEIEASHGIYTSLPIQCFPSLHNFGEPVSPINWREADELAFQTETYGFDLGSDLYSGVTVGETNPPWRLRLDSVREARERTTREMADFDHLFEMAGQEKKKKKKKEEEDTANISHGGPGDDPGSGGCGRHGDGGDGGDGDGSGGGAAGGTSGSGGSSSSYDPFWGFNGDGNGWFTSMVAVFMLAWLALQTSTRNSWTRLPSWRFATRYSLDDKVAILGISNNEFGSWDTDCSSGDLDHGDGASGDEGRVVDATAADLSSKLDRPSSALVTKPVQLRPKVLDKLDDAIPKEFKAPKAHLPRPYPPHYSTSASKLYPILSLLESRTRTGTKSKAKHVPKTAYTSSILTHQDDLEFLEASSLSRFSCFSSTIRAF